MHDINLHIGDLIVSWAKHGPEERGLLFNLMLHYYKEASPLPADPARLAEIADCRTAIQRRKLAELLSKHYRLDETGPAPVWRHRKTDLEIARYQHRCLVNAHNNLCKFIKTSARFAPVSFEKFSAHPEHYQDPITGRFRNLTELDATAGAAAPPANHRTPKVSESETIAPRKNANLGATLPLSHSPTLPSPGSISHDHPGRSDSQPASSEPHPPSGTPDPEKKEGAAAEAEGSAGTPARSGVLPPPGRAGAPAPPSTPDAEVWLSIDSAQFRALLNETLLRAARHPLSSHELHEIGNWAAQACDAGGHVATAPFHALAAYLRAAPVYTCDDKAWQQIPDGSALRRRKRSPRGVIEDLANQLAYAQQWAAMGEKKKTRPVIPDLPNAHELARELGMDPDAALPWADWPASARAEVWQYAREKAVGNAEVCQPEGGKKL